MEYFEPLETTTTVE